MLTINELAFEFERLDPEGALTIDRHNRRRLIRALEVTRTIAPFSTRQTKQAPLYDALMIGLSIQRDELVRRIDARVDDMIALGLIDEVKRLREQYGCDVTAMSGIGYRQLCRFLAGGTTLERAIEEVKRDTRRYAKRQMTVFRADARIH